MTLRDYNAEKQKILYAKYNALLLREKLLLHEKMIFKHYFDREYLQEARNPNFERFYNQNLHKTMVLDLAQKYDVVRTELQTANTKWEQFESKKDQKTDDLLATNQEIISNIKDIKMEVYELNRKIDIQSENPKTGKIDAKIFEKFFEEKFKKLKNLREKLTEQNNNLKKQILVAKKKIKSKDNSNELEFIDFHQLQIENKKYVKDVDEKNKLLLKLKMTIGKITQDKNKNKERLQKEIQNLDNLTKELENKANQNNKIKDMTKKKIDNMKKMDKQAKELTSKQRNNKNITIDDHVRQKMIEEELRQIKITLEKKLQIEQIKNKGLLYTVTN
jgi:hypothetical protein